MARNTEFKVEHTHGKALNKISSFPHCHYIEQPLSSVFAPYNTVGMSRWLPILGGVRPMFESVLCGFCSLIIHKEADMHFSVNHLYYQTHFYSKKAMSAL